ncbi:squamous cell carcinoma antigen recognized by T-cells 3-like [Neocloeon triangulifer]|uniref:squamous cell carcinoma antigen recognized by T-cells 3-like n=1 Tax=Neocloeon triangulifer TaxID=2078957 RepID=UPI00286ED6F8|nr:squamous cell carcinoma antigen recognized by T-cells 3-like [Neocloeon triangulifer]
MSDSDEEMDQENPQNAGTTEDEMDRESEDSSSEDDEFEKQDRMVAELKKGISKNSFNYDLHVQLIDMLQKMGELDKLREAREQMSKIFPLTEDLWLSWLRDEIKLVASEADRQKVTQLFERAVKDYLSVEIWLEWAQFNIGAMAKEGGLEAVRALFDRALTAVGLHTSKGAMLWEAYREFEAIILGSFEPQPGSVPSTEQMERQRAQRERIQNLFKRQLSVPLLDMEATREELRDWAIADEEATALYGYEKALAKLKQLSPFEENLLKKVGDDLLAEYRAYINHEKHEPARVQILYERAVSQFALNADLWLEYIKYIETTLRIKEVTLPVIERALRNVPWDGRLWVASLRAGERYGREHLDMQSSLETALVAGLSSAEDYRSVWEAYLDYLRRRVPWDDREQKDLIKTRVDEIRHCSTRACEHLAEMFGVDGDPQCSILRAWARCEAARVGNLEKSRKLWTDIMSIDHMNHAAAYWLEYIHMERACGDEKHLRKLFARALNSAKDWPEGIAEAWVSYEREQGCLESFEFCLEKVDERMERLKIQRAKEREKLDARSQRDNKLKRKRDKDQPQHKQQHTKVEFKKPEPEFKKPSPFIAPKSGKSKVAPPPGYKPEDRDSPEDKKSKASFDVNNIINKPVEHDSSKDNRTVFISNLSFDASEDDIKTLLGTGVVEVRLARDFKGRSKGFGYVEFKCPEDAGEALLKDREMVAGRPVFISKCDPDNMTRQKQFRYSQGMEKNKLFIKGLPFTSTKEDLEKRFSEFGALKDVRLVTYRNGHFKGLAYVEFEDETAAAHALLKTDGLELEGKPISVAISRPPERKQTSLMDVPSLGGRPRDASRPQRSSDGFMPRALRLAVPSTSGNTEAATPTNGAAKPAEKKTNDFFRSMFAGGK